MFTNKIKLAIAFMFLLILASNIVYGIDAHYAFTIEVHKQNDEITASLDELHLTSVSDLADESIKAESDYAYKIEGQTAFGDIYYEEHILLDLRTFMGADQNCFEVVEKEPETNDNSGLNDLIQTIPLETNKEPPELIYDPECGGMPSIVESEEKTFYVNIPYIKTIDNIKIYDKSENVVAELDLSQYADYCGDNICSYTESYLSCPLDCMEEVIPLFANQIFRTDNSEISSNKKMSSYVTKDLCIPETISCAEVVNDEIYVKAKDNSVITINNNNEYKVFSDKISDDSEVQIKEKNGIASVTKKPFKVKGDWSQNSDIHGSFQKEDGTYCNYDFDSSITQPVTIKC